MNNILFVFMIASAAMFASNVKKNRPMAEAVAPIVRTKDDRKRRSRCCRRR